MGVRGARPKRKSISWSAKLAYAVGLIATDGCLSGDGRHIELTSKDKEQLLTFMQCVGKKVKISTKKSGYTRKLTTRIQFSDVTLYSFFISVGLTPNKTKTIGKLEIPDKYFFDFLRGSLDGDGSFYSYWDPRWRSSFMFYLSFVSASMAHLNWIRSVLTRLISVRGHKTNAKGKSWYQLKYAKKESLKIIKKMYYSNSVPCLQRKRKKIFLALKRQRT
ncbi:hypothetical protein K2P56_04280 [Patescibacteria group bacterium]|nr:hypothetical protein [Patescibacteria group bacterium]